MTLCLSCVRLHHFLGLELCQCIDGSSQGNPLQCEHSHSTQRTYFLPENMALVSVRRGGQQCGNAGVSILLLISRQREIWSQVKWAGTKYLLCVFLVR